MKKKKAILIVCIAGLGGLAMHWFGEDRNAEGPAVASPRERVNDSQPLTSGSALLATSAREPKQSSAQQESPADKLQGVAGLESMPRHEQISFWMAFSEARHAVRELHPKHASLPENAGVAFFASQPKNNFTMRFLEDGGLRLQSGRANDHWSGTLRLATESRDPQVKADKARVEIRHSGDLVEWYENRPEGLEHGFTVISSSADMRSQDGLQIELSMEGMTVQADAEHPGDLIMVDESGNALLGYQGLKVWDADGSELPSEMSPDGAGFLIAVHDAGARYPITIDPLIVRLQQLFPDLDSLGQNADKMGRAVAVSLDVALVGAPLDDTPAGIDAGSAYLFRRDGSTWILQEQLMASDAAAGDWFGDSVALSSYDFALVGAPGKDDLAENCGAAYVFFRTSVQEWSEQWKLSPHGGVEGDSFGYSVDIDGTTAAVGARLGDAATVGFTGNAYVFTRVDSIWSLQQKLTASDAATFDFFGTSLSLDGDSLVVGAQHGDNSSGVDGGSAYVFVRSGTTWTEQQKVFGADAADLDSFGVSVAISGDVVVVGAHQADTAAGTDAGAAYVFTRSGGLWTQSQKLEAADSVAGDLFGRSVALSGGTLVVGAPYHAVTPGVNAGAAYVLVDSEGSWTQQQKLSASDGGADELFGGAVSISGNTVVVGASSSGAASSGSGYVYKWADSTWTESQKLLAGWAGPGDHFGLSIAMAGDFVAVGAPYDDAPVGVDVGAVYAFARSGDAWESQMLQPSDMVMTNYFGVSVAVTDARLIVGALGSIYNATKGAAYSFVRSGDAWVQNAKFSANDLGNFDDFGCSVGVYGNRVVVGARYGDSLDLEDTGCAYVYEWVLNPSIGGWRWEFDRKLTADDGTSWDLFGGSVAISADTIAIGAQQHGNGQVGAVYLYSKSGNEWEQRQKLVTSDGGYSDQFGCAVAISGEALLVGANGAGTADHENEGSAYVFTRDEGVWAEHEKLRAFSPQAGAYFGTSVAISGNMAIVGAPYEDTAAGADAGSVHVFERDGSGSWRSGWVVRADDAAAEDRFGYSVAVSGSLMSVGAGSDDTLAGKDSGSAHVFRISSVVLSPCEVVENQPVGTALAQLSMDGETQRWFFSLVEGQYASDNGLFTISGSDLVAAEVLDYEQQQSCAIRVQASNADWTVENSIYLKILDDRSEDADGDGLSEEQEEDTYGTSDTNPDDDGDGILGGLEVSVGLDPAVDHRATLAVINDHPADFGLEVNSLILGQPTLQRDASTGALTLTIHLQKSVDAADLVDLFMQPTGVEVNADGNIDCTFTSPDGNEFYRVEADSP